MSFTKRLLLDASLLLAILTAYRPGATGITVHEWLSLSLAAPVLVHLVVNWDWVGRVARRLFRKARGATRLNFAVDTMLFVATVAVMLSGLMVSRVVAGAFGLVTDPEAIWHTVHSVSADATLTLAMAHLVLHWKWIARVVRTRWLRAPRMAPIPVQIDRRR
jgi:hypothetical protein